MKKVLLLCMLFAFCVCLSACAQSHIDSDTQNNSEPDQDEQICEAMLCGKWFGIQKNPETMEFRNVELVFEIDGSCMIDGEQLVWQYAGHGNRSDSYAVKAGDYIFLVYSQYNDMVEEYYLTFNDMQFFKADNYHAVALTKDNWAEHFELVADAQFRTNAWGETTGFELYYCWQLREDWGIVHSYSEMIADVQITIGVQKYTANLEQKSYTLEGEIAFGDTITYTVQRMRGDEGAWRGRLWRSALQYGEATVVTDMEPLRVYGLLYLMNP